MTQSGLQFILYLLKVASCKMTLFFSADKDIKLKYNETNTFIIEIYKLYLSLMMFNRLLMLKQNVEYMAEHYGAMVIPDYSPIFGGEDPLVKSLESSNLLIL